MCDRQTDRQSVIAMIATPLHNNN